MCKWDAKDYKNNSKYQEQWARELIAKIKIKPCWNVLDIGCGDGRLTAIVAEKIRKGKVLGIDNSESMVKHAKNEFNGGKYKNLEFISNDARKINFKNKFDLILSNSCLHWVIDHQSLLKRIKMALKPNGKIFIQMGGKGNAQMMVNTVNKIIREDKWEKYFRNFLFPWGFYGAKQYRAWLKQAGLKPDSVKILTRIMRQNKAGMTAWIRTTWLPYTQRVPEKLRKEFLNEILQRYIEKHPLDSKGLLTLIMKRLEIIAERQA